VVPVLVVIPALADIAVSQALVVIVASQVLAAIVDSLALVAIADSQALAVIADSQALAVIADSQALVAIVASQVSADIPALAATAVLALAVIQVQVAYPAIITIILLIRFQFLAAPAHCICFGIMQRKSAQLSLMLVRSPMQMLILRFSWITSSSDDRRTRYPRSKQ